MGSRFRAKRGQKSLFRKFLENGSNDFVTFLSKRGSYGTLCVCKVWSPAKIWFSRYGAPLVTPKRLFRLFLENYPTDFEDFLPEEGKYDT